MAGKRLLDAAALFKASRAVASKHLALRTRQLDVYNRTSSLVKAVKHQTDRLTLTVQAASALAQRFDGPSAAYSTQASWAKQARADGGGTAVPSNDSVEGNGLGRVMKEGIEQDHFYEKREGNTTAEPLPNGELGVRQEKAERFPLPDGTIPPAESDIGTSKRDKDVYHERPRSEMAKEPLAEEKQRPENSLEPETSGRTSILKPASSSSPLPANEAKKLQRQAEFQIPSRPAEPPTSGSSSEDSAELGIDQEKDVFYKPSANASPVLSSLPRVKVPKVTEDIQESDEHVQDAQINQDVYYSASHKQKQAVPEVQAIPEQNKPSEEMFSEIFHSPRVAKMLNGKSRSGETPKALKMKAAENTPVEHSDLSQGKDQDTFNVRSSGQKAPEHAEQPVSESLSQTHLCDHSGDKEIHKLAADMAKDVETAASPVPKVPAAVEPKPTNASYQMHESRVPSSRFGRLWQYGGLATSMAFGAVGESLRRATGGSDVAGGSLMLSAGNMERLVAKLSRMRGAALKLGQMMSFQDSKMLPAPIHEVLQRVQDNADYMPASQRDKVMSTNLGHDWRDLFESFDELPMAAASIGQVHGAVLRSTGQRVAVKVQYPGVANSIDSDLNNLSILLTASRLLPKGLYLDKTIANARIELAWECDYIREAECVKRFTKLLKDEQDIFLVPGIIDEASGAQVLTMERMEGLGVTKVQNFTQDQKDWIGTQILRLCLREITEFKFMQTDPNWTNFLFNSKTQKLELLDFGASREYPDKFIDPYIRILSAASRNDREACQDLSIQLGYLTGHESQAMLKAHITSVITLAEPFRDSSPEVYDLRDQTITERTANVKCPVSASAQYRGVGALQNAAERAGLLNFSPSMQFPKLTPLQSRFATSLAASLILVVLYLALSNPHFAYADADSITHEDHNHPLLLELQREGDRIEGLGWEDEEQEGIYEPEFAGIDRGIIGRAPAEIIALGNNAPQPSNINAGDTQYWVFPNETLWGPLSPVTPGLPSAVGSERRKLNDDGPRTRLDVEPWDQEHVADLEMTLKGRQDGVSGVRTLYITFNTCRQPSANATSPTGGPTGAPPQLQMYVSQSDRNQRPGPNVNDPSQRLVPIRGGFASAILNATGAVYIGMAAPNNSDFSGVYNYELAASIDAPYHSYDSESTNLFFVDSDTNSALLVTNDTTQANPNETLYQKWMTISPPFSMFAHNENDSAIRGIENSYCGMKLNAQIVANKNGQNTGRVEVGMTNRGLGRKPKEQFHIKSLNGSSTYYGFLAMDGNSTNEGGGVVGGGGKIWKAMNFSTKSDGNCQLLFDLSYCSEVAYAVPSNPNTFPNIADLKKLYDDNARNLSQTFSYSLQQIPCNTSSSAQYSLARNCDDCADAYKTWLCAVTIPRCYDFSSNLPYLQPRNVAQAFINGTTPSASSDPSFSPANQSTVYMNSSRNPLIDTNIKPGPYKEVLPCQDLCYTLVQSCPAALGFACPLQGRGLNWSYGVRDPKGDITCSYLGAAYFLNAAGRSDISATMFAIAVVAGLWAL